MGFSYLYPFTKAEVNNSPTDKGVYELFDAKGEVVYIGSSEKSIRSRLLIHKSKTKFMKVKAFRFMRVSDDRMWTTAKHIERSLCTNYYLQHGCLPRLQKRAPKHVDMIDWISKYL